MGGGGQCGHRRGEGAKRKKGELRMQFHKSNFERRNEEEAPLSPPPFPIGQLPFFPLTYTPLCRPFSPSSTFGTRGKRGSGGMEGKEAPPRSFAKWKIRFEKFFLLHRFLLKLHAEAVIKQSPRGGDILAAGAGAVCSKAPLLSSSSFHLSTPPPPLPSFFFVSALFEPLPFPTATITTNPFLFFLPSLPLPISTQGGGASERREGRALPLCWCQKHLPG